MEINSFCTFFFTFRYFCAKIQVDSVPLISFASVGKSEIIKTKQR